MTTAVIELEIGGLSAAVGTERSLLVMAVHRLLEDHDFIQVRAIMGDWSYGRRRKDKEATP